MPFKTQLNITSIRGTNKRRLFGVLIYYTQIYQLDIVVPVGFETDFATIPRIVCFFINNDSGIIRDAAVIHDYLYSTQSENYYPMINKDVADTMLLEGMKDLGAGKIKRYAVYHAVRLLGGLFYRKS